jgi:rhamnogalacturonyl hydrolase YesR
MTEPMLIVIRTNQGIYPHHADPTMGEMWVDGVYCTLADAEAARAYWDRSDRPHTHAVREVNTP